MNKRTMNKRTMLLNRRPAVGGLLLLAAVACTPQEPAGQEPAPAVVETAVPAGSVVVTPETPAASVPEALALRFVSPNLGPAAGGNDVTIDGQGFDAYPRIAFGGVQAWVRSVTPAEIRVTLPPPAETVPAGETLIVDVTVTNPPRGSEEPVSATLSRSYSYVAAAPPTAGPPTGVPPAATATQEPASEPRPKAVETPPTAAATAEPTLIASFSFEIVTDADDCPPPNTSIRFTDRSTGGVTEWWWELGDGDTSKEQHNQHCYTVPGMRSVTLTVGNADESASTSKIVTAGME